MKWNKSGQLVYEDKTVPASHSADLIGDSMRERKGVEPVDWKDLYVAWQKWMCRKNWSGTKDDEKFWENLRQDLLKDTVHSDGYRHLPLHPNRNSRTH